MELMNRINKLEASNAGLRGALKRRKQGAKEGRS
jgi:hypothetical protein